jgi:N-acyl-L-homoserine lactone synthetase
MPTPFAPQFTLTIASEADMQKIYKIRHHVYAKELGQHKANQSCELSDELDSVNHYIVAKQEQNVIGFISITPPCDCTHRKDANIKAKASEILRFCSMMVSKRIHTNIHQNHRELRNGQNIYPLNILWKKAELCL